jgi:hypothetical protein
MFRAPDSMVVSILPGMAAVAVGRRLYIVDVDGAFLLRVSEAKAKSASFGTRKNPGSTHEVRYREDRFAAR